MFLFAKLVELRQHQSCPYLPMMLTFFLALRVGGTIVGSGRPTLDGQTNDARAGAPLLICHSAVSQRVSWG